MGNFIILPDQRLFLANGVAMGSSGYGYDDWAVGQSYAKDPVLRPAYYNHTAPAGSRFDSNLPASTIPRLYHSAATLLPDGSVFISGSNPNADVITMANNASYPYKTEYRTEIFYPSYFDAARPVPTGIPNSITYGGAAFNLTLPASSLNNTDLRSVTVALIRTGFSTHGMNMGMRYIQLANTVSFDVVILEFAADFIPLQFTGRTDGSAILHVSQLAPNAALFVPGPALLCVSSDRLLSRSSLTSTLQIRRRQRRPVDRSIRHGRKRTTRPTTNASPLSTHHFVRKLWLRILRHSSHDRWSRGRNDSWIDERNEW